MTSNNVAEIEKARTVLKETGKSLLPSALRAVNKTLPGVRTDFTKAIRGEIRLTAADVRGVIDILKAHVERTKGEGAIRLRGKRLSLMKFRPKPTQTKAGVKAGVKTVGRKTLLKHAFIATMQSGHEGVFWRARAAGGKFVQRLPIQELFGPDVPTVAAYEGVLGQVLSQAAMRYYAAYAHELDRDLDRILKR